MNVFKELYQNRKLIWKLSKNDFRNKFAGAHLAHPFRPRIPGSTLPYGSIPESLPWKYRQWRTVLPALPSSVRSPRSMENCTGTIIRFLSGKKKK